MANASRARLSSKSRKTGRAGRPRKARRRRKPRKDGKRGGPKERQVAEGWVAVKHYGESWEFEHYEKESMKASGVYL
jgi:membrane protein implicated in regulation of membrane protease activity